jgi:hypothetical protein
MSIPETRPTRQALALNTPGVRATGAWLVLGIPALHV